MLIHTTDGHVHHASNVVHGNGLVFYKSSQESHVWHVLLRDEVISVTGRG